MMRRFIMCCLVCILTSLLVVSAQDVPAPIIGLRDGSIIAINPEDGSLTELVAAPAQYDAIAENNRDPVVLTSAEYDAIAENNRDPVVLTSAEWLSPDGQYLAYRVVAPIDPNQAISPTTPFTKALYILDLNNPTQPIRIAFPVDDMSMESLAWSLDNNLLYVLANLSIHIINRQDWTIQTSVDVGRPNPSQAPVISRRLYASESGVVLVDNTDGRRQPIGLNFSVFNQQGESVNAFQVDYSTHSDTVFYSPFEPLELDGHVQYGFLDGFNALIYAGDFAAQGADAVKPFTMGYGTLAMASRPAGDQSLRISLFGYENVLNLSVWNADGVWQNDIPEVQVYAYGGYSGDHFGTRFALSPDGQSLAYLKDGGLMLWKDGETSKLEQTADVIVWAPPKIVMVNFPQ